ncbi:MAG TPA: hypothetical protein VGU02_06365 [Gaiellaceae bacterium]|nr:hypothetical protein [Gaiellaceae bacterium]
MKSAKRLLVALEAVIASNAIGGGIYGLAGAKNVPRAFSWLQPTFFVLGIAVVKLAYRERVQIAGRSRRGARKGDR